MTKPVEVIQLRSVFSLFGPTIDTPGTQFALSGTHSRSFGNASFDTLGTEQRYIRNACISPTRGIALLRRARTLA